MDCLGKNWHFHRSKFCTSSYIVLLYISKDLCSSCKSFMSFFLFFNLHLRTCPLILERGGKGRETSSGAVCRSPQWGVLGIRALSFGLCWNYGLCLFLGRCFPWHPSAVCQLFPFSILRIFLSPSLVILRSNCQSVCFFVDHLCFFF